MPNGSSPPRVSASATTSVLTPRVPGLRAVLPLILLTLVIYVPFLDGGFRTDDFAHVERLSQLPDWTSLVTSPDIFGFFRPLTQASLWLDLQLFGEAGAGYRVVNLALHAVVLALAFLVCRALTGHTAAAWFTTLAFALTPKAHPIAVLWISARAELCMTIGTLTAVLAWVEWTRGGGRAWIATLLVAYAGALLSKETAILLPAVLLVLPSPARPWRSRVGVALGLVAVAVAAVAWRAQIGARMPTMDGGHYLASMSLGGLLHNLRNYAERMAPAPLLVLVACGGCAALTLSVRRTLGTLAQIVGHRWHVALVTLVWPIAFLAPTLPFTARSELYVYLPVLGPCLLVGLMIAALLEDSRARRSVVLAASACAIALSLYQAGRAWEMHRDHVFSSRFVATLAHHPDLAATPASLHVVSADASTARFLQDAVGGYFSVVLRLTFPGRLIEGSMGPALDGTRAAVTLVCGYDGSTVSCRR